jgi:hypothetical protein
MQFFIDLLEMVEICGLELTSAGSKRWLIWLALVRMKSARRETFFSLRICSGYFDRLVDGEFILLTSGWIKFFPTIKPFSVMLNLWSSDSDVD